MAAELPKTMRAAQWTTVSAGGLAKNLTFNASAPLPKEAASLPKNATLVKVAYTTVNPIDYKLPESTFSPLLFSKPSIPCCDFSGTVVATTLFDLKEGDRVCGKTEHFENGAMGEWVVVKGHEGIVKVPERVSLEQAACVGVVGVTSYQCLAPYVKTGDKVFINGGSGGTGTVMIQMAKAMGCEVTTTCSGPNVELCKSLGADKVIDYRTTDVITELKRKGVQYDHVVDCAFPVPLYYSSHYFLKPNGWFITIAGSVNLSSIMMMTRIQYLPSWLGGGQRQAKFLLEHSDREAYEKIMEWMADGKVKMVVEKRVELEEARDAFVLLKTGRTRGKIIVRVGAE